MMTMDDDDDNDKKQKKNIHKEHRNKVNLKLKKLLIKLA